MTTESIQMATFLVALSALIVSILVWLVHRRTLKITESRYRVEQEKRLLVTAKKAKGYHLAAIGVPETICTATITLANLSDVEKRFENLRAVIEFWSDLSDPRAYATVVPVTIAIDFVEGASAISSSFAFAKLYTENFEPGEIWIEVRNADTRHIISPADKVVIDPGPRKHFWEIRIRAGQEVREILKTFRVHPKRLNLSMQFDDETKRISPCKIEDSFGLKYQQLYYRQYLENHVGYKIGFGIVKVLLILPTEIFVNIGYYGTEFLLLAIEKLLVTLRKMLNCVRGFIFQHRKQQD